MAGHVAGIRPKREYELYAVSNHYGTVSGGHYTAYCRNAYSRRCEPMRLLIAPMPPRWHSFDDSTVTEIEPARVVSAAAYVLFYTSSDFQLALPTFG